jgi:hypothetical protein
VHCADEWKRGAGADDAGKITFSNGSVPGISYFCNMAKTTTKKKSAKPAHNSSSIESNLGEKRLFKPSKQFAAKARISSMEQYEKLYRASIKDPEKFFAKQAEELHWFKKWRKVLEWKAPFAKWFIGGKINASYNCIDRHLVTSRKNKAAIIWEGENFEQRTLTYSQLHREVSKAANVLKSLGVAPATALQFIWV